MPESAAIQMIGFGTISLIIWHYFGDVIRYTLFSKKKSGYTQN